MKSGLKGFQRFCGKGDLKILFRRGHDGKWLVNFFFFGGGGGSGFLEIPTINFASRILFDVLFTRRLKDLSLAISHLFLAFHVIKSFLIVFYFIRSFFNTVQY